MQLYAAMIRLRENLNSACNLGPLQMGFTKPVAFASGLTGTIYGRLQDSGFFFDPVQREIEQQVVPWLKEETEKIVARHATARCLLLHMYILHPYAV